jgi:xylan 1,4-beta-xylosidase
MQQFDWRRRKMVGERTQIVNGGVDVAQKPIWIEGLTSSRGTVSTI